jgi:membrane associated rhomboid family serine protease
MPDGLSGLSGRLLPGGDRPVTPRGSGRPGLSLAKAARAMVLVGAFVALLWVIQLANWTDSYRLNTSFEIIPHSESHLADIITAPFLHISWQHLEGNSVPLLVLGFLAAYRGVAKFLGVTAIAIVTSGLAVWLFQSSNEPTVGASGVIFGYFGYVVVRGLFDRNFTDAIVGALAAIAYASILAVAIPGTPGVSWIGHAGGLAGGVLAGWILRVRRRPAAAAVQAPKTSPATSPADNSRAALHKELGDMGL